MNTLTKVSGLLLLAIGASSVCFASAAPEIDPVSGANALALLAGTLLVIRGRRR